MIIAAVLALVLAVGLPPVCLAGPQTGPGIHQQVANGAIPPPAEESIPMPPRPRTTEPEVVLESTVFGFIWPKWDYNKLRWDLLTDIAFFGPEIDSRGNWKNKAGWPDKGLIDAARANGVAVSLSVMLFEGAPLNTLLSSPANRANCIANIVEAMMIGDKKYEVDGVCIDFEGVRPGNKQDLVIFARELRAALPGKFITFCGPAKDWAGAYDYDAVVAPDAGDAWVIMGYDYHGKWSNPGPNAPLSASSQWGGVCIENTLADYTADGYGVTPDRVILIVPYYGQDWECSGPEKGAKKTGVVDLPIYKRIKNELLSKYERLWDESSQTPWIAYQSNGVWHQCWYDDAESLDLKYKMVKQFGIEGIGIFCLRYDGDNPELWEVIEKNFTKTVQPKRQPIRNWWNNR